MGLGPSMLMAAVAMSGFQARPVSDCDSLLDVEQLPGLCEAGLITRSLHPYNPQITGPQLKTIIAKECRSAVEQRLDGRAELFQARRQKILAKYPRFDPKSASDHDWFLLTFPENGVCSEKETRAQN